MLHKLIPIDDDPHIVRLGEIFNAIIEFVCHPDNPYDGTHDSDLEERIAACCPDAAVARWIHAGKRAGVPEVSQYLLQHPADRDALKEAVRHDYEYYAHADDESYTFALFSLPAGLQDSLKALMTGLYEALGGEGLPTYLLSTGSELAVSSYARLWRDRNTQLCVCPACDGPVPDVYNGKALSDLDHFLPKSVYSLLALHPRNLVPICMACNQRVKKNHDPMLLDDTRSMTHAMLPYRDFAGVDVIEVKCGRNEAGAPIVTVAANEAAHVGRVRSLDDTFGLAQRWTGRVVNVPKELVSRDLSGLLRLQQRLSLSRGLRAELRDDICAKRDEAKEQFGQQQGAILRHSYLSYLLDDTDEFEQLVASIEATA